MNLTFGSLLVWLDIAGVVVFAASGALVASRKHMDPIGFVLIATITAVGGGTLRDLLLDLPVFWIDEPNYVILAVVVALLMFIIAAHVEYRYRLLLWADAIGLSVFAVLGSRVAMDAGYPPVIATITGLMTATFGGLLRDVLCQEVPLILRREIYATAAVAGAIVYASLVRTDLMYPLAECLGIGTCLLLRSLGLLRGLTLPGYKTRTARAYPVDTDINRMLAHQRRRDKRTTLVDSPDPKGQDKP